MKLEKPVRIDKSFTFLAEKEVTTEGIPYIKIKGYASKMVDASGDFVIDADRENINTMGIDLKRLMSGNLPLLFGHDQSKPVGKVLSATYKTDGLEVEAILYKLPNDQLTNFVYESVKVGTLNSFSVGILVEEFDMIEKGGKDYLQLAKSEIIELSIVSVPSNSHATFGILESKSVSTDEHSSFKTVIAKDILKAENPNVCSDFEQCIIASTKGLTYEETSSEDWVKSQDFHKYMSILVSTIEDNWYGKRWEDVTAEEALQNIKDTCEAFVNDLTPLLNGKKDPQEIADALNRALAHDGSFAFSENAKAVKGDEMINKDVTTEEVVEPVVTKEEEVIAPEAPVVPAEPVIEPVVAEVKPEAVPEVQEPLVKPADTFVADAAIIGANIGNMSLEDLEKYFNSVSMLQEVISDYVTSQIQEAKA